MCWKGLALEGNNAFAAGDYFNSLLLHQKALSEAQGGFADQINLDPDAAISAVLVCWLNMADACAALGMIKSLNAVAVRAEGFLIDQMLSTTDEYNEIALACL